MDFLVWENLQKLKQKIAKKKSLACAIGFHTYKSAEILQTKFLQPHNLKERLFRRPKTFYQFETQTPTNNLA